MLRLFYHNIIFLLTLFGFLLSYFTPCRGFDAVVFLEEAKKQDDCVGTGVSDYYIDKVFCLGAKMKKKGSRKHLKKNMTFLKILIGKKKMKK